MPNHTFVESCYKILLSDNDLNEMKKYISNLKKSDFKHKEIIHRNPIHSSNTDVYRVCEIHFPNRWSPLYSIGKKIFLDLNKKYFEYDLDNIFEFQLIKYYKGGNYNWHCDYGTAEEPGLIRKLSMSIQLTPPENYDGGELQVVDYSNRTINIPTDSGTVVVFDSKLPHKVCPVTWGQRLSLVGWANGPRFR